MLERALESRDDDKYNYEAGDISNYGKIKLLIEGWWITVNNLADLILRGAFFLFAFMKSRS